MGSPEPAGDGTIAPRPRVDPRLWYTGPMLEPPRQNWALYESRCRQARLVSLRSLSIPEAFDLFEEVYRFGRSTMSQWPRQELERYELSRFREKLARRRKLRSAFTALDRLRDARGHPEDASPPGWLLSSHDVPFVVVGGVAAARRGEPRFRGFATQARALALPGHNETSRRSPTKPVGS